LIGGYVHSDDKEELNSIKNEVKRIRSLYLNPEVIIAGDFNNMIQKMRIFAGKTGMNTSRTSETRAIQYGNQV